jgi:hypothetical protein
MNARPGNEADKLPHDELTFSKADRFLKSGESL